MCVCVLTLEYWKFEGFSPIYIGIFRFVCRLIYCPVKGGAMSCEIHFPCVWGVGGGGWCDDTVNNSKYVKFWMNCNWRSNCESSFFYNFIITVSHICLLETYNYEQYTRERGFGRQPIETWWQNHTLYITERHKDAVSIDNLVAWGGGGGTTIMSGGRILIKNKSLDSKQY